MSTDVRRKLGSWAPTREHKTLAEHAFDTLREAILRSELEAGQRLSIDDLSAALGMSKMPIRDALRRLEAVGLVETRPYRGTHVSETSIDDLRDVYQTRLAVETLTLRCAAERFTDDHAVLARERLDRLNELPEGDAELWPVHRAFHWVFYEASGSTWLPRVIGPLWETSERYRFAAQIEPRSERSREEHERILEHCVAHDPGAAAIAHHDHLVRTANTMAESMGAARLFDPLES